MGVVTFNDNDDVVIKGGTDTTPIGNIADRLKVDAQSSISPVPLTSVIYKQTMLLNGSAFNMNVNGSVTPVNFDFSPPSGETWYLEGIGMILGDPGTPDFNEFGSLGAVLTNGCDLLIRSNGTEYTISNIKSNVELQLAFAQYNFFPGNLGWLNEVDMVTGMMLFNTPIRLQNSTSDYVRVRVRDNLTGLLFFSMGAKLWRTI